MKTENIIREYVRNLSDEDLKNLLSRLMQNLSGDKAEVANILSKSAEVDKWLKSANSSNDFFSMMDEIEKEVSFEFQKRNEKDKKEEKSKRKYSKN
jgi:hypothetical protein